MAGVEITREQWEQETERLCPSPQAYNAYVELEQFVTQNTGLTCTYKSMPRGKSDYATFHATAGPQCSVIQVYKGQCQLNWRWKPKVAGLNEEERAKVDEAYETFRASLEGKEGKGWETVKVRRLGEENVHEAVKKVADDLVGISCKKEEAT